ncbi:hypothetical protein CJF32_00000050 [Rutstroemia sp. NJR-2017a WRK4]|nr:hypothetical protein CJF32_00000050 [Rutstroemia sp. NJR-2017a WRK4]
MSAHPADTEHKGDKGSLGDKISGSTIGVQNIEAAYSRAGASAHHTPGAASKLGTQNQQGVNEGKGMSNPKNGADGRPQEPSMIGSMVSSLLNGSDSK